MPNGVLDLVGSLVAALLTVMILSYLWRDNPAFRVASYLFVGVAAGYAGTVAWHTVLNPGLVDPFLERGLGVVTDPTVIVPWVLVLLLIFKVSPTTTRLGSVSTALMVGVGAAVVVGGAITGTLIPQSLAAMTTLSPGAVTPTTGETGLERVINVLILLAGTIATLMYFRFGAHQTAAGAKERAWYEAWVARIGQVFIAITFGVMYAGVLMSTIIVLGERVQFLVDLALSVVGG